MNNPPRVNYDAVSSSYDLRATEGYLSDAAEALNNLAQQVKVRQVPGRLQSRLTKGENFPEVPKSRSASQI